MEAVLQEYLGLVEAKKAEIVLRATALPESERTRPAPGNGWSAAQVVEHLIMFEEYMIACHTRAISSGNSVKPGFKGRFFTGAVGFMIRRKVRFGTTKEFEPPAQINLVQRLQDWCALRDRLAEDLAQIKVPDLGATFAIHPIAGPLDVESTLKLLAGHLDYHIRFFPPT